MKPWPERNVDLIRADARAGWTMQQSALRHGFQYQTVKKHADLHSIVFVTDGSLPMPAPSSARPDEDHRDKYQQFLQRERVAAEAQLAHEIAWAKEETWRCPPYRGGCPDDV